MVHMKETLRHIEAFEYLYSLGEGRSYASVARQFNVAERNVQRWANAFDWPARIVERDRRNGYALARKTDQGVVSTKAAYRAEIRGYLAIFKSLIERAVETDAESGTLRFNIKLQTADELARAVGAVEKLVKLDLLLQGEATEITSDASESRLAELSTAELQQRFDILQNLQQLQISSGLTSAVVNDPPTS